MYLKQVELIGFKSFANRTRLDFGKGMTAIVGPNGCGKSNVSDAVRWVLGETSAKALRGGSMTDVIFNGTDFQKPMGMAEVSLTLAECEGTLSGVEYDEVTITRRVLRSGEGQYFINKAPCRLKDIQRLFMDTGIGTNSYSVLEQGRIDRILSSRPEDRREVFEEASGITKYKADKKEALRKLEQTENNLLRLEDIIAEVKRQIISLQRQAGKARRYKEMMAELRAIDIYVTRERLGEMDQQIVSTAGKIASLNETDTAFQSDIDAAETQSHATREALREIEQTINETLDQSVRAKTELERTRQLLMTNQERVQELVDLSERNANEAEAARERLALHQASLQNLSLQLKEAVEAHQAAEELFQDRQEVFTAFDSELSAAKNTLRELQSESVDVENRRSHLQNELGDIEARERSAVIKRERLMAELKEAQRTQAQHNQRVEQKTAQAQELAGEVVRQEEVIQQLKQGKNERRARMAQLREELNAQQREAAAKRAQIELLQRSDTDQEPYPGGARFLMNPPSGVDVSAVLGPLADHIEARGDYRKPLEAIMRPWLDALIVRDQASCLSLLGMLERDQVGAVRFLIGDAPPVAGPKEDLPGEPLVEHVVCDEASRQIVARLLHRVRVIGQLSEISSDSPEDVTWVTYSGLVARGRMAAEYWMPESGTSNPLTRKHMISMWQQEAAAMQEEIARRTEMLSRLSDDESVAENTLNEEHDRLTQARRDLAVCEGETQQIRREAKQNADRESTIQWELDEIRQQESSGGSRRAEVTAEIERLRDRHSTVRMEIQRLTEDLHARELERERMHAELTECRISVSEKRHRLDQLRHQEEPLKQQIRSLEQIIQERSQGITSYQRHIENLRVAISQAEQTVHPLEEQVARHDETLAQARNRQREAHRQQAVLEEQQRQRRLAQEEIRRQRSQLEVQATEQRMRRQNTVDRMISEYQLREEQLADEPEPVWDENMPQDRDSLDTLVAELRTKINSMGPVNLVAIEEHQELEERFQFLTQQQTDLVNSRLQLLEMIKKINQTTTELFSTTFNKVNENFQTMFAQMFGGGSAKLVLVNEEDVLESGIEIIARPPGKKLQNISLLSGGERTMTAVALLFALYMVKPSPFCLLDELDAALDDSNIGRFVKTVQGFVQHSQFIVITHSRQTIAAADVLYGVTMEKHGISNVVAVRLSDHAAPDEGAAQADKKSFAGKGS